MEIKQKLEEEKMNEKEIEILRFINEFGFCDINQIMKRFGMKKSSAYLHMKVLTRLGLMIHLRLLQNKPGVYYLTSKAISLLDLDLPVIRQIPIGIYVHQLSVIDTYLQLRKDYPHASWISERRLFKERKDYEHLPDGVLVFPDGKQIAIEVEITMKSRTRLDEIMTNYALQSTFKEVWYFCARSVHAVISKLSAHLPFIKTYALTDSL